jgi:hypothetical protein
MFDQDLSEVGENPPVTLLGCVCATSATIDKIVPGNPATDSQMIHFFRNGVQTGNDVAETFAIGQLGERHDAKVIGALEGLNVAIPVITVDTGLKASPRHAIHDLRENKFSLVHWPALVSNCPKFGNKK